MAAYTAAAMPPATPNLPALILAADRGEIVAVNDAHIALVAGADEQPGLVIIATERAYLRMLELIKRVQEYELGGQRINELLRA